MRSLSDLPENQIPAIFQGLLQILYIIIFENCIVFTGIWPMMRLLALSSLPRDISPAFTM